MATAYRESTRRHRSVALGVAAQFEFTIALHHVLTDGKHRRSQPLGNYAVTTTSAKHACQAPSADRTVEQKLDQIANVIEA
jgi:hypothetical protein